MSWPFHSLSRHSLIKNLRGWDLKAQPSRFIHPNVISFQFLRFSSERPRYLFLPTSTRPVIGQHDEQLTTRHSSKMLPNDETRNYISSQKKGLSANTCGIWKHEATPNQFKLDPYYYYPSISPHTLDCVKCRHRRYVRRMSVTRVWKIPKQWKNTQSTGRLLLLF